MAISKERSEELRVMGTFFIWTKSCTIEECAKHFNKTVEETTKMLTVEIPEVLPNLGKLIAAKIKNTGIKVDTPVPDINFEDLKPTGKAATAKKPTTKKSTTTKKTETTEETPKKPRKKSTSTTKKSTKKTTKE